MIIKVVFCGHLFLCHCLGGKGGPPLGAFEQRGGIAQGDLPEVLGREVDLHGEQAIKNPYLRKSVDTSKMLICERAS